MGSAFSFIHAAADPSPVPEPSLGDLPESVVGSVLVRLSPLEICRLAALNRAFRGASSADFVWESKLPPNYDAVIARVFDEFPSCLCKRDIYARLSRSNSFDGGTKSVWLDKSLGKVCLSVSSNGLAITGIDDRRYWSRIPTDESRFQSVAYLQQVWWFEVCGEVDFPFPAGRYSVFFRLHLGRASRCRGRSICETAQVHGWDKKPVKFHLSTADGQKAVSQCHLNEPGKWKYYHAGDFSIKKNSYLATKVKFSMTQIDCTHTKGGLCVDSVLIYPSEFKERLNGH